MKVLVVTVAGMSTRFSESVGETCLKCIYYEKRIEETLLYRLLHCSDAFDKIIVVGGFLYEKLQAVIEQQFADVREKLILVKNEKFKEYGSGYSLYIGMQEALKLPFDEIVFAEGDLFFDLPSFQKVVESKKDVISYNRNPVWADKAVAFYFDTHEKVHYIYDVSHHALEIREPFLGVFNSGQVWKFAGADRVRRIVRDMCEEAWRMTNLVFIQNYFGELPRQSYEIIEFAQWINCNTVMDFREIGQYDENIE